MRGIFGDPKARVAVIAYDKDLPEIPGRRPWEEPTSFLVKDDAAPMAVIKRLVHRPAHHG